MAVKILRIPHSRADPSLFLAGWDRGLPKFYSFSTTRKKKSLFGDSTAKNSLHFAAFVYSELYIIPIIRNCSTTAAGKAGRSRAYVQLCRRAGPCRSGAGVQLCSRSRGPALYYINIDYIFSAASNRIFCKRKREIFY